jgi:glycerol-1-phosphate dehydrogenase [NAD(P)+]
VKEKTSMNRNIDLYLGEQALGHLIQYCRDRRIRRFLLVCDRNTYAALGQRAKECLNEQDWDIRTVILEGAEVVADERRVFETLFHANGEDRTYIAAGSGTITDITRFASHCARTMFLSLPTAPSVDAYSSGGAALVMRGFKLTVPCQAPAAVFADLPTLCEAPRELIAAGFGDIVGKYTSLADWRLGTLLLAEPYSDEIAGRLERALATCVEATAEIRRASPQGIRYLMQALLESGFCMTDFGSSRPASGSEHMFSHFWELRLLQAGRPAILHGTKVGVGTILAAQRYERLRSLSHEDVVARLARASLPALEHDITAMRTVFGPVADPIIADHRPFLEYLETNLDELKQRIEDRWAGIQEIAARVPPPQRIASLLSQVGGPIDPQAIGLKEDDVQQALKSSRYMRNRFTVNTLGRLLGTW